MPLLSIVIPSHNDHETLPRLLDSVLEQSLKDVEVIIVDDCSETSCAQLVDEYAQKGLTISLIRNEVKQYTKDARLTGVKAARGEFITCADADDWFYGQTNLEDMLALIINEKADILHFQTCLTFSDVPNLEPVGFYEFARPYIGLLEGQDIFAFYAAHEMPGHTVWGKIYRSDLWQRIFAIAHSIQAPHYREDLLLYTLLVFHAKRYLGVNKPAYVHLQHRTQHIRWGRGGLVGALTIQNMLRNCIPYLSANGCPEIILNDAVKSLKSLLHYNLKIYARYVQNSYGAQLPKEELDFLLSYEPMLEKYLEAMTVGYACAVEQADFSLRQIKRDTAYYRKIKKALLFPFKALYRIIFSR